MGWGGEGGGRTRSILDLKVNTLNKPCINYIQAGVKLPKWPKLSSRAKIGRTYENNISTVNRLLTLISG